MVPLVPPPSLNSAEPVEAMVNVPVAVIVPPPIFGEVVCPVQFQVKLEKDCVILDEAPNQVPADGEVNPEINMVEPVFQVASGITGKVASVVAAQVYA